MSVVFDVLARSLTHSSKNGKSVFLLLLKLVAIVFDYGFFTLLVLLDL